MITRNRILFAVGIWTMLVPLLGFPSSYETFFAIASGVAVALLAFLYARDKRMADIHGDIHNTATTFAENRPSEQVTHGNKSEVSDKNFHPQPDKPTDEKYTDLKSIISRSKNF